MTFFRSDRSVEALARSWKAKGPYRWEIRDSYDRGDYLLAVVDGHGNSTSAEGWILKVRGYGDSPRYEIDVIVNAGATKPEEKAGRRALDAAFRKRAAPQRGRNRRAIDDPPRRANAGGARRDCRQIRGQADLHDGRTASVARRRRNLATSR